MLDQLAEHIRVADVLDVVLAAGFFYLLITWVQRSPTPYGARRVLITVGVLAGLYAVARRLEMALVEAVSGFVLLVLILGAVVVFQTDIRRMVDRFGALGWLRSKKPTVPLHPVVDMLSEASARLAERRWGALIALRGAEPWDRYIEGGIRTDAVPSLPLVVSLFNPTSPGHDGAVLIEEGRITRFGAHLPLSSRPSEVSPRVGTRHAAALGLSEQCDALVIVVSEERGTISVAEQSSLTPVSAGELKARLNAFWSRHYESRPAERAPWWGRWSLVRASSSLLLAVVLWLLFVYRPDTVYRTWRVPIEFRNLASEWMLEEPVPTSAQITLAGTERAFRAVEPGEIVLSLDLSRVEEGVNELVVAEDNLQLPPGISLYRVEPSRIEIDVERQRSIRVPVEVRTTGSPPESLDAVLVQPIPDSVTVLLPEDAPRLSRVVTEPVDLSNVRASTVLRSRLLLPAGARLPAEQDPQVQVYVQVQPRER